MFFTVLGNRKEIPRLILTQILLILVGQFIWSWGGLRRKYGLTFKTFEKSLLVDIIWWSIKHKDSKNEYLQQNLKIYFCTILYLWEQAEKNQATSTFWYGILIIRSDAVWSETWFTRSLQRQKCGQLKLCFKTIDRQT